MRRIIFNIICLLCVIGLKAATPENVEMSSDSLIVADLRDKGIVFSHDNSVVLFNSGQKKYDDLFTAIRHAKSSVHLEYFNFLS